MDIMKIYTKTGDKGTTSLLDGKRVEKYHPKIEAYGTVDELNSFLGLLRSESSAHQNQKVNLLEDIQNNLFHIGSALAANKEEDVLKFLKIEDQQIYNLEKIGSAVGVVILSYVAQFFIIGFLVILLIKLAY